MSKPGLGKSLGDLMQGDQVAGKKQDAPAKPEFGRGMQRLVQPEGDDAPPAAVASPKPKLIPVWFYFAADLLLLAFTVAVTFDTPKPFDFGIVMFCAICIATGALLAIVGINQAAARHRP
jgi:hypothetical protein